MVVLRCLAEADRAGLDGFLDRHRASSMFLRSNLFHAGLNDGTGRYQGLYAGRFVDGDMTDVAAHYWNGNIILQAPDAPRDLAEYLIAQSGRPVSGALGPWAQVQAAEPHLPLDRGRLGKVVPEYLYSLSIAEMKTPDILRSGDVFVRRAAKQDLPTLVAWRRIYDRITMGFPEHAINDDRNAEMFRGMIADDRLWVLEENGTPMAMTAFNATLPDTVQVGGVFTCEAARGKGYALAAVAGSLLSAQGGGVRTAILFTEVTNVPAQKAYEALGFARVGDYGMVVLDPE